MDSAEKIGLSLGIPSFIIGVTIVAFGTSLPELATSIASVFSGTSEIVIGNAVGSNITNILLVIGATAVVGAGIKLDYDVMKADVPMLFGSAFLLYFALYDRKLSTIECVLFLAALSAFLAHSFSGTGEKDEDLPKSSIIDWCILIVGAAMVYFSAKYTIVALEDIATDMGIPPHIIAITVVALGTSLPEVVVSINAARKGNTGMAIGNVLGSNIFNTYAVMAIPGLIGELKIPEQTFTESVPLMIAVTILFGVTCISKSIPRYVGWTFLVFYVLFLSISINGIPA